MKLVIFKHGNALSVTPEDNYKARIMDARKIQSCADFGNAAEIIEYYVRWFGSKPEDFIVKEGLNVRKWFDIESAEIVTENQLREEFEEMRDGREITFEEYVINCQTKENGTLVPVWNVETKGE